MATTDGGRFDAGDRVSLGYTGEAAEFGFTAVAIGTVFSADGDGDLEALFGHADGTTQMYASEFERARV